MFISRKLLQPYYADKKRLEKDLLLIADSSKEDNLLFEWLKSEEDVWETLAPVFERRFAARKGFGVWLHEADNLSFRLNEEKRRIGAFFVIVELREYAGHSLWNRFKSPPHYEDIVKAVHERVAARFKRAAPESMSVEDREISLSAMLLGESLDQLSPEVVERLLKDSQFKSSSDFDEVRSSLMAKLKGGKSGFGSFRTMLGKTIAKRFGTALIESAWGASKLAGAGRIGTIASRVLPFALRRAGLYLSLGFLLKDAYQLGGEATRVTNPAVIIIALYRSFSDHLGTNDRE